MEQAHSAGQYIGEARLGGHRLLIRAPAKPWRDSRSLEEDYIVYTSFEKVPNPIGSVGAEMEEK
ncbi:MAG: hypothetical protein QXM16_00065 [Nitrososphaerota archaeon]